MEKTDVLTSATTPTAPTCVIAGRATMWTSTGTLVSVSGRAGLGGVKSGGVCCGLAMYDTYCKKCLNAGSDAMHLSCKSVMQR